MFTTPFWVAFGCALLASLAVALYYGRHAIHPRLRPHFGQVVIMFLLMALVSFILALLVSRMVGLPPVPRRTPLENPAPPAPKPPAPEPAAAETPAEPTP